VAAVVVMAMVDSWRRRGRQTLRTKSKLMDQALAKCPADVIQPRARVAGRRRLAKVNGLGVCSQLVWRRVWMGKGSKRGKAASRGTLISCTCTPPSPPVPSRTQVLQVPPLSTHRTTHCSACAWHAKGYGLAFLPNISVVAAPIQVQQTGWGNGGGTARSLSWLAARPEQ
jgi:hypothetical protein